ncbi:MAG: PTS sugar transporter subunit IIB [Solobacterium sp.]|nr:PTS sugar transporter subunit IIB [Solobacterium sp.]MBQ1446968.1 PTS sugar transporter subunit IIB [Solobacterium sp.]MBQ6592757.1 PTS sugar transporter subunit IIB [Solobacterium sp.]
MIVLLRIDDRLIHGQVVVNWVKAFPCEGLIAVNDAAASVPLLKMSYRSAAPGRKVFVWSKAEWEEKKDKVLASKDRYFLLARNAADMADLLRGIQPGVQEIYVGPCSMQENAVRIGDNQALTQEDAAALEALSRSGYEVIFALVYEKEKGRWRDFRSLFGYE